MESKGEIRFSFISKTTEEVVAEMPIEKGVLNPFGVVNTGAIIWFADVTASVLLLESGNIEEGMKGFPLAININANLTGNASNGKFIAKSTYLKKGRTVSVVRTIITNLEEKIIADVTTNHVRSA